jgi:hypothetical protein
MRNRLGIKLLLSGGVLAALVTAGVSYSTAGASVAPDSNSYTVAQAVVATATVSDFDGNIDFSPPQQPATADLSPQQAVSDALGGPIHPSSGVVDTRVVLVHLVETRQDIDADAWLVIYDGSCVPVHGPLRASPSANEVAPGFVAAPCVKEPFTTAVDAQSGADLGSFDGGPTPDPEAVLQVEAMPTASPTPSGS